ncbi:MAG TPA: biotin carboxylase N-terminal domain-containing protein [Streptosporangiaceae bacterium]|nr:biotin carboxylase N-terminal domain-containing protein [Streptosporangiaceae bacterium]
MAEIYRLLVANRGEIARRIFRTCRQAGIGTVAVFSDPDAGSPHVAEADLAVRLPGASSAQTYLNGPALVAAALAAGADAVHPGYGFLAEDAGFAQQVLDAGLVWVGPPPKAMRAMALKILARKRAAEAGVPVLSELDPASVTKFPVLVKASAGGGGRGMRAAASADELDAAIESASREAQAAFGDGTVFCEPLLIGARHIEVQVLADTFGTVWALAERDCSVQRRYAKVIEETPSPAVSPALRKRLQDASIALAKAVGYVNAGTVEFLVGDGEFFFLEFNTRLQVEHPVTECVHSLDLVALQLAIAQGEPLPTEPPLPVGHAIEARLYAEDPLEGFRPSGGEIYAFTVPDTDCEFGLPTGGVPTSAGGSGGSSPRALLRVDAGVVPGSIISAHYDAMLAKVISWAPTRSAAIRRLSSGLAAATIAGPVTNRDLLTDVLRHPEFAAGRADTSLLDGYDYAGLVQSERVCQLSAAAAAAAIAAANRRDAKVAASIPGGWRNVPSQPQRTSFTGPRGQIDTSYRWIGTQIVIEGGESGEPLATAHEIAAASPGGSGGSSPRASAVWLEAAGLRYRFNITRAAQDLWIDSPLGSVRLALIDRLPAPERTAEAGSLIAPMPGSVTKIAAAVGDPVSVGQLVLVIEAMKMEHQILAPTSGVLAELRVSQSTQVNAGDILAIVADAGEG